MATRRVPLPLALAGLLLCAGMGAGFGPLPAAAAVASCAAAAFALSRSSSASWGNSTASEEVTSLRAELEQMNGRLSEVSRAAGTAEIATGVLHNVGNVLNSVNVSATLAASRLKGSSAVELTRMLRIVEESGNNLAHFLNTDERGAHFYTVLKSLSESIEIEREGLGRELRAMNEGLDHIKELLRSQQSFAMRTRSLERMRLDSVIDQAVAISNQALTPQGIEVVRQVADLPEFDMDGHRIMEVLVNLLQNAKQAILGSNLTNGRIVIMSERTENGMARVSVTDSGPGISKENLQLVFQHGFTTRSDGHGFGLHASAAAAKEMGGSLNVENTPESEGGGARFTLELPIPADAPLPSNPTSVETAPLVNAPGGKHKEQEA